MAEKFTVTKQTQTRELTESGHFMDAMRVDYRTSDGAVGWVIVPLAKFNAKTVGEAIAARVAEHDAIAKL